MATTFRPDKPQPIFADRILSMDTRWERANEHAFGKERWRTVKQNLRSADKFVLTQEAFHRIVDAMNAAPEQIVHNSKFALPPTHNVWIEVQNDFEPFSMSTNEFNTGYLVVNGEVNAILEGLDRGHYFPQTYVVDLNTPPTREEMKTAMEYFGYKTLEEFDRAYWGDRLIKTISPRLRGRMRLQHRVRPLDHKGMEKFRDGWGEVKHTLDLHIRMVIATFLAFNQPKSVLNITAKEAQRRLTAKGRITYLSHNVVTIHLGSNRNVRINYRTLGKGTGDVMPWHKVLGHWMHFTTELGKTCTHGYGQDPDWWELFIKDEDDGKTRYECRVCGSRRVWREYPEGHGNGAQGMSLHHHVVQG